MLNPVLVVWLSSNQTRRSVWHCPQILPSSVAATHLGINGKIGVPRLWRNDFAEAILRCLGRDLSDVLKGFFPLLLCRTVRGRFLETVRSSLLLDWLWAGSWLTASLNRSQVERSAGHRTQRVGWLGRRSTVRVRQRGLWLPAATSHRRRNCGWGASHGCICNRAPRVVWSVESRN